MVGDIFERGDLAFPKSLPQFQKLFPNDAACAAYLEQTRWEKGFVCPLCKVKGEPYRFAARPGVLRCRACRNDTALTAGTVMERTRTPLTAWFWAAYLVASQTPGMSAVQFQRQLGLTRYETAFGILHKLRAGMVRPDQDRIGGIGRKSMSRSMKRGSAEGRAAKAGASTDKSLVAAAVEVRRRKPGTATRQAEGRPLRRSSADWPSSADRSANSLCGFVESAVMPGSLIVTDDWSRVMPA